MTIDPPLPPAVADFLRADSLSAIGDMERIEGGCISLTRRLCFEGGATLVLKQSDDVPDDMYAIEAEGLAAIRAADGPRVPDVLSVGPDHIFLEDLGPKGDPPADFWPRFGEALARLHNAEGPAYGYHRDGYLGKLPVENAWSDDGHDFFLRTRVFRMANEPLCDAALEPEDRRGLDRLARRIEDLIPPQTPRLIHGDLWHANMSCGPGGDPCCFDPSVYYGWPDAELAMTTQIGGIPESFYDAYRAARGTEPGWEERWDVLGLREYLAMMAHFGNRFDTRQALRDLIARFA
ncbi:MAG: fructosamine kinase family protein [Fimbriimonadaceae bacterium]|nr:fructosamine kinase family protein [Fimbriimonadaceae bacterium]